MQTRKILIITKTYPSISTKYRETVCTAGILLDDQEQPQEWIRIYPVRYRDLGFERKYKNWTIIEAAIEKNDKDSRLESYRINDQSIRPLREIDTRNNWEERKKFVSSLMFDSVHDIQQSGKSLGMINPQVLGYKVEPTEREWPDKQQVILDQGDLFRGENPFSDLEKIPYKFLYRFQDQAGAHRCSIIDWGICELYRKMRNKSQASALKDKELEALEKVRIRLEDQLMSKDWHFLMGNLNGHRNRFVIIGLMYPPVIDFKQLNLLD